LSVAGGPGWVKTGTVAMSAAAACLVLIAGVASGQAPPGFAEGARAPVQLPAVTEIVVTGERAQPGDAVGSPDPILLFSPDDIDALGAANVGELLDAIKLEAKGAGDDPIYLVNGRRVSSLAVMRDLPPEAVLRIQVLPEVEALRYGYTENQRVINVVLKDPYKGVTADGAAELATEGGSTVEKGTLSATDLVKDRRFSINLTVEQDNDLLASERGLLVPPASDTDLNGSPSPSNLAPYESLRPWKQQGALSAVISQPLGPVTATLEASVVANRTRSEQGLPAAALTIPPTDPFAHSDTSEQLSGYVPEAGPLQQTAHSTTSHFGLSLDAPLRTWTWSLVAAEDHIQSATNTVIGFDLDHAQALLDDDNAAFDPFLPLQLNLLDSPLTSRATSTLDDGVLDMVFDGEAERLPAGSLSTTVKVGGNFTHENSQTSFPGLDQSETLTREQGRGEVIVTAPLASRRLGVLPWMGDLSTNLDLAVDKVSDFGVLKAIKAGFAWSPIPSIHVHGSWNLHQDAPKPQDLEAPTVVTPNVSTYDYLTNQTVLVTELSGGNPDLKADEVKTVRFNLDYAPWERLPLDFMADWSHSDTTNLVATLPVATADVEAAFPDRFIRNESGNLVEINATSVNFARQEKELLVLSSVFHMTTPPLTPGAKEGHLFVAASDTWTLDDTILIRPGLVPIDLLQGGAVAFAGGQPVHVVNLSTGFGQSGVGAFLTGKHQSSTTVDNGLQNANLFYSPLTTVDLRTYLDLGARPSLASESWARGLRITLSVTNLFDARQTVHNGLDQVPLAFQSAYLDPVGRFVHLELRKIF
jgi:iron complex outermembrane recepter protein